MLHSCAPRRMHVKLSSAFLAESKRAHNSWLPKKVKVVNFIEWAIAVLLDEKVEARPKRKARAKRKNESGPSSPPTNPIERLQPIEQLQPFVSKPPEISWERATTFTFLWNLLMAVWSAEKIVCLTLSYISLTCLFFWMRRITAEWSINGEKKEGIWIINFKWHHLTIFVVILISFEILKYRS